MHYFLEAFFIEIGGSWRRSPGRLQRVHVRGREVGLATSGALPGSHEHHAVKLLIVVEVGVTGSRIP